MTEASRNLLEQHFDTAFAAPGGIKKLRELILTLAMQGKLVAQDPNDPPASELLKAIEAEKERLHALSSPRKRGSSGVKDVDSRLRGNDGIRIKSVLSIKPEEVPYELPEGWEWVRLARLADIQTGKKDVNQGHEDGLYPFFSCAAEPLRSNEYSFDCEALLLPGNGANVGLVTHFKGKFEAYQRTYVVNNFLNCSPEYIEKVIKDRFLKTLEGKQFGSAINYIKLGNLTEFFIPLPPLPEQHRIVAKIDQLMAKCDELEKLRAEREEKRRVVHAAAIRRLLDTPSSFPRRRESSSLEELAPRSPSARGQTCGGDGVSAHGWNFIQQHFSELYTVKENVTELRKTILQLAVMGRLVPQDPNDPPASELLKEIEAEKQRLHASSSARKRASSGVKDLDSRLRGNDGIKIKSSPPIKPEEVPYELPQGWEWVRLSELAEFINGDRGKNYPNRDEYVAEGVPWINTGHIEPNGSLTTHDMYFITREKFESLNSGKIQLGDLVYCLRGATFGKTAIVDPYIEGAIASSLMIIRPFIPLSNRYMYLYLIGPVGKSQIFRFDNGSAQPNLSANSVRLYVFPLPPLPEQHRIVAKIDQLMALCDRLEQQIDAATGKQNELLNAVMAAV